MLDPSENAWLRQNKHALRSKERSILLNIFEHKSIQQHAANARLRSSFPYRNR